MFRRATRTFDDGVVERFNEVGDFEGDQKLVHEI
jgi:hypothetical protein